MELSNADALPEEDKDRTSTGAPREVRWVVVARTPGITAAEIIVGRLRSEDIPARAWQEGAGEALGLMVGILGTGNVVVPEEFADRALAILESDEDFDDEDFAETDEDGA